MKYTLLLIAVYLAVFAAQSYEPSVTNALSLSSSSALSAFTYMFVHVSPLHFVLNMLALFMFGRAVEGILGSKMLLMYMASGAAAGMAAMPFYPSIAGASGAIYGLVGISIVMKKDVEGVPYSFVAVLYGATAVMNFAFLTGVANIAHLAGIASGATFAALRAQTENNLIPRATIR